MTRPSAEPSTRGLRYLIVGAGALGSTLGAYLTHAAKDVTLVARGEHLRVIQDRGLTLHTPSAGTPQEAAIRSGLPKGRSLTLPVRAVAEPDVGDSYDVVFVTVKEYSLDDVIPLLDRLASRRTLIVPLLNSVRTGERIAQSLTGAAEVAEGVAYIGTERPKPGEVVHKVDFFRIVLGARVGYEVPSLLSEVADDLRDSGLAVELSDDMMKSSLIKLIRVAALSATMLQMGGRAGDIAANPAAMSLLRELCEEIAQIGDAVGSPLDGDPVADVLAMTKAISPQYRTSLKEDFDEGRPTEIKAQILDVLELGTRVGVDMPAYRQIAESLKSASPPNAAQSL